MTWANLPPFFQFQIVDDEVVLRAGEFLAFKEVVKGSIRRRVVGPEKSSDWGRTTFEYIAGEFVQANK